MTHPRSAFGAPCRPRRAVGPALRLAPTVHRTVNVPPKPPQGGAASGRSEPVRGVRSMIQIHAKEVAFGAIEG